MNSLDTDKFGPWAVVTGASSGIGTAFAHELASRRLNLVLVARRREVLQELAAQLEREHGVCCRVVALDLADPGFVASLRATTDELDVGLLVSNAGTATAAEFVGSDIQAIERDIAVNATAHWKLAHHFGGRFAATGRGGILLVSSIAGRQPVPYLATYAASKCFVTMLGESLSAELRSRGVTVTVLVAGPTDTPMRTAMGFARSRLRPITPKQCATAGLLALARGEATHTPGRKLRVMLAIVPRRVITRILGKLTAEFAGVSVVPRLPAPGEPR